jgi:hypothetical protein
LIVVDSDLAWLIGKELCDKAAQAAEKSAIIGFLHRLLRDSRDVLSQKPLEPDDLAAFLRQ